MKSLVIAKTTFRELLREKIFHIFIIIAFLFFGLSFLLGSLSFDEQKRILLHLGFAGINLALVGISCGLGSFSISREIERQTCLLILARPLSRTTFYLGKWLGIWGAQILVGLGLGACLYAFLGFAFPFFSYAQALFGVLLETSILLALAFFMVQVVRPAVALFSSFGIYLMGQWLPELKYFTQKSESSFMTGLNQLLNFIVPHFYRMNWRSAYLIENNLIGDQLILVTTHGLAWTLILLVGGASLFKRRDLV